MHPHHFHRFIIRPTLKYLHPVVKYSKAAEILLLGTALHESANLKYWKQGHRMLADGNGVARGPYGIEPATLKDIYDSVLFYRQALASRVAEFEAALPSRDDQLITNPAYATIIARLVYWRWPDPMPDHTDLSGLARFHEKRFNSIHGAIGKTSELEALYCFEGASAIVLECEDS